MELYKKQRVRIPPLLEPALDLNPQLKPVEAEPD